MAVRTGEVAYYLSDFVDEIMPCDATLEAWAEWLSKPDPNWEHEIPRDGQTFDASALRFHDDIVATRHAGNEWTFSRPVPDDAALIAVRFGPGLGWWPDNIITQEIGEVDGEYRAVETMEEATRSFLADCANGADDEEYIAVAYNEPLGPLTYRSNPARLELSSTEQSDGR